jgi:hypothetical protein
MSLRNDGPMDHILVTGQDTITLLRSHDGYIRGESALVDVPISRIATGDWSRDGLTDIIVVTPLGYYGLTMEERMGTAIFSLLLWATLLLAAIVSVIMRSGSSSR